MSIVETALAKLRRPNRRGAEPAAPRTESGPRTAPGSVNLPRVSGPAPVARAPLQNVTFDRPALIAAGLLPPEEAARRTLDEMRRIKWPLLEAAFGDGAAPVERRNVLMVVSPLAGDGKTVISLNLALSMAMERGRGVLLIDADIPNPQLSRSLGLQKNKGLADLLVDETLDPQDLVVGTDVPGLELLPAGGRRHDGPEFLASQRMQDIIDVLVRSRPQHILLFDCPPLLQTNESHVLARLMGQILMVVCADKTPKDAVREALDVLGEASPVKLVLNKERPGLLGRYYGGYYGHDYGTEPATS